MSVFFSQKYKELVAYTPGEQPQGRTFVKLNTNESPFSPTPKTIEYASKEAEKLMLYSDPDCRSLVSKGAEYFGVQPDEIIFTNGSDEILNFAFMAFCDEEHPVVFPDITYGFYSVFAQLNRIPYEEIPLKDDFTIDIQDYIGIGKNIFIANPNAPTGIALTKSQIEQIVSSNPHNVVVIDEAYVDFGGESCVDLIHQYSNLLVTQTFSKSRSLAGARLGMGFACKELIQDLNTIRFSTNPYNINRMTMAAGVGALEDDEVVQKNIQEIIRLRSKTAETLQKMGFEMTSSSTNFLFARSNAIAGKDLYLKLKEKGVLVRHFDKTRLTEYNRITIGNEEQMNILIEKIQEILSEK